MNQQPFQFIMWERVESSHAQLVQMILNLMQCAVCRGYRGKQGVPGNKGTGRALRP